MSLDKTKSTIHKIEQICLLRAPCDTSVPTISVYQYVFMQAAQVWKIEKLEINQDNPWG